MASIVSIYDITSEPIYDMDLEQYINFIVSKYYKNINQVYVTSYIHMILNKDRFPIDFEDLIIWKALPFMTDNCILLFTYANRFFDEIKLVKNKDYIIYKTWLDSTIHNKAITRYALTVSAFKRCLIQAGDIETKNQFLLLDECNHQYTVQKLHILEKKFNRLMILYNQQQQDLNIRTNVIKLTLLALILILSYKCLRLSKISQFITKIMTKKY